MTTYYSEPGIINAADLLYYNGTAYVGLIANDPSPSTAQQNTLVLRYLISLANAGCGVYPPSYGTTILIPGHSIPVGISGLTGDVGSTYYFQKPNPDTAPAIIPIACNWPIRFLGTGSTVLALLTDNDTQMSDFFWITTSGVGAGDHTGGMTFEDLYFLYPHIDFATSAAAIHIPQEGAENVRIIRCSFVDSPTAIQVEDALQVSVMQCKFQYKHNVGTSVILGNTTPGSSGASAKQVYIAGNTFYADHSSQKGNTGIVIYGADHVAVADTRIDAYTYGIKIIPGPGRNALHCTFTGVTLYPGVDANGNSGTALTVKPTNGTAVVQAVFTNCAFEPGDSFTLSGLDVGSPGIIVDGSEGLVDNIRFVSCYSTRWAGPGLQIVGGATNIEVVGGFYSGNNFTDEYSTYQPHGIYVGDAVGVRIVGTSCKGQYQWIVIGTDKGATYRQDYGIYVDDGATDVVIAGCDIRENGKAGIFVNGGVEEVLIDSCNVTENGLVATTPAGIVVSAASTPVTNVFIRNCDVTGYALYSDAIEVLTSGSNAHTVQVTDCAGYNDQAVGGAFTVALNSPLHAYDRFYYGPATVYIPTSGSTSNIKVGATATAFTSGTFVVAPGVAVEIVGFSGTIPVVMVGQ